MRSDYCRHALIFVCADPAATVTVNENPTFRMGSYFFGSDSFDNSTAGGFAALLVQKYRKELAAWLRDPKLDLAHEFKEEGTWNGEVTIDCCDKGKGVDK